MEIKRDIYLNKLINKKHNGLIKVITGIRRCGKSYLLFNLFKDHLLAEGVDIGEKDLTRPARLEILSTWESDTGSEENGKRWESEIRLTIHEGKFHQVKRMMEALGKKVTYLKRLSMGPLALPADLPTGKYRLLTEKELELLKSAGNR